MSTSFKGSMDGWIELPGLPSLISEDSQKLWDLWEPHTGYILESKANTIPWYTGEFRITSLYSILATQSVSADVSFMEASQIPVTIATSANLIYFNHK